MADRNDDDEGEQHGERKGGKSSSKSKDLSHVPCKFFKVGSCTAGASCPFSHAGGQDNGGQKETCTWFVKGNCKFGHKCALAHILPGQTMAMDRKNKKAAQLAAGGGAASKEKGPRGQRRENNQPRNPLLAGMTAPTRPVPLKATPAPPLKDTDFESKVTKPLEKPPPGPYAAAVLKGAAAPKPAPSAAPAEQQEPLPVSTPRRTHQSAGSNPDFGPIGSPPRSNGFTPGTSPQGTSPFSAPGTQSVFFGRQPQDESARGGEPSSYTHEGTDSKDFRARSGLAASLGTLGMTRKWNAPEDPSPSVDEASKSESLAADAQRREAAMKESLTMEFALEDDDGAEDLAGSRDDLEEFIPSSLTELLTPEERSRRMSRSISGGSRPTVQAPTTATQPTAQIGILRDRSSEPSQSQRYSRSVPAPSLLGGDLRNIWAGPEIGRSPPVGASPIGTPRGSGFAGEGTPGSYKSNFGGRVFADGGGRSFGDSGRAFMEEGGMGRSFGDRSIPTLSPSNASAAFLPGLHAQYQQRRSTASHNNSPLYPQAPSALNGGANSSGPLSSHRGAVGSPSRGNAFGPLDAISSYRPIPPTGGFNPNAANRDHEESNSLTSRALQSHAPGQSLPQGLAAGYSRIHNQPLPPNVPSPAAFSPGGTTSAFSPVQGSAFGSAAFGSNAFAGNKAFSPSQGNGFNGGGPGNFVPSWQQQQPQHQDYTQSQWNNGGHDHPSHHQQQQPSNQDLDAMFSRLSYSTNPSAPRSSGPPGLPALHSSSGGGPPGLPSLPDAPPGLGSRTNSGRQWANQGPLSPLSGPGAAAASGDDDDLFSMDG